MDVLARTAPPPGSAQPGDLYVDLQSRTLWLGVDPAVDEDEFVLISDIVAMQAEIDGSLVEAKAYTDTKILTRAPTVHTHTSAQITDLTATIQAVVNAMPGSTINRGMIGMFSGSLAEIGVGEWAGWALCDGSNGTPDLRDKFVLGAGNRATGSTNPVSTLATEGEGSHIHVINGHVISIDEMPSHYHGSITGYMSHDHAHHSTTNTGTESHDHAHGPGAGTGFWNTNSGGGGFDGGGIRYASSGVTAGRNQAHYHGFAVWSGGVSSNHYHGINAEGGYQAHDHTEQYAGYHAHNIASTALREAIPFYALAFIMKL